MRLNLNFQVRDLDGKPFTDEASNAGKIFASALAQHTQGPIAKTREWIDKLWKKQEIEIDETDRQLLLSFLETTSTINLLSKSQRDHPTVPNRITGDK